MNEKIKEADQGISEAELITIIVRWIDTTHVPGWYDPRDIEEMADLNSVSLFIQPVPAVATSTGFKAHETDDVIILAQSAIEGKFGDLLVIPKRLIVEEL